MSKTTDKHQKLAAHHRKVAGHQQWQHAIEDYLQWMTSQTYSRRAVKNYKRQLNHVTRFIEHRKLGWHKIFTRHTLESFQKHTGVRYVPALTGLARYLFATGKIAQPLPQKNSCQVQLPKIYDDYLAYQQTHRHKTVRQTRRIKRVLKAFVDYLQTHHIDLSALTIAQIDDFLAAFLAPFSPETCNAYRSMIRQFLRYLYQQRQITKTDLSPLITGAHLFSRAKPPNFLRPHEVQKVFAELKLSTPADIRTYAMVHLAYMLGLRPQEICSLTLDDISFRRGELKLEDRKTKKPIKLPLPKEVIKAIAAYLIGVRPQSKHRTLFLALKAPYGPLTPGVVGYYVSNCMRQAAPCSSAYWLRHTYAQNLLEAGVSIYEIKEMLGHDSIESTKKYLHIHIKLMRKVLFDETI